METTNIKGWEMDLSRGRALHSSGFCLRIDGDPKDPSAVTPVNYAGLTFGDQARLLNEGLAAVAAAAHDRPVTSLSNKSQPPRSEIPDKSLARRFSRYTMPRLSPRD